MTLPVQLLDSGVVGVSVRHVEGSLDGAAVGVDRLSIEDFLIQINVVRVNGSIKGNCDHLRYLVWINFSGNSCSVGRAETVGQLTHTCVAVSSTVGILNYYRSNIFCGEIIFSHLVNTTGILI